MMHYRKGENVEMEIKKENLPFEDCFSQQEQKDFLWMHVKGGTKVPNVVSYAKKALETGECRTVVWSGSGGGVVKTISCAEILKRNFPLYQVTRMCYTSIEEHWKPQMEGLDEIVANRKIPCLHILMSLDTIDAGIDGVQRPNTKTDFWPHSSNPSNSGGQSRKPKYQQGQRQTQNQPETNRKTPHHARPFYKNRQAQTPKQRSTLENAAGESSKSDKLIE